MVIGECVSAVNRSIAKASIKVYLRLSSAYSCILFYSVPSTTTIIFYAGLEGQGSMDIVSKLSRKVNYCTMEGMMIHAHLTMNRA